MKKIIFSLFLFNLLVSPLLAQTGNLLSGTDAGVNIGTNDEYNTAFGYKTLISSNISNYNTAFGAFAGYYAYYGTTSIGYKSGYYMNSYSVNIGVSAGYGYDNSTSSSYNLSIGHNVGIGNKGSHNILIGENTGNSIIDTDDVISIGHNAGYYGDERNIFIGHSAGYYTTGGGNVVIGNDAIDYGNGAAGYELTTGVLNVLLGNSAGSSLGNANYCTFIGTGAGANAHDKNNNTFVGGLAGYNTATANTSGNANYNTLIGYKAGYTNIAGQYHTVLGYNADFTDTSFTKVVMIGANTVASNDYVILAGYSAVGAGESVMGIGSEISLSGNYSTGLGYQTNISGAYSISAGYQTAMTGDSSIGIGYLANVQNETAVAIGSDVTISSDDATLLGVSSTVSGENSMALGYNLSISNNNQINIGNDDVMSISGIVNWTTTSDGRLKSNIQEDISGLDFILKLRPVTYFLKMDGKQETDERKNINRFTGFIAQEVEVAAQSTGYNFSGIDRSSERYGLRYSQFTIPLVKAIQELHQTQKQSTITISATNKTDEIDALLENLEQRVEALNSEL